MRIDIVGCNELNVGDESMAGQASDYKRGEMDIAEQTATFRGAMLGTKWGSLAVAVGVLFLTLMFCTDAGFVGAVVPAAILAALGIFLLRERPATH